MCGIAGVWFPKVVTHTDIRPVNFLALAAAGGQHRGHAAAGITEAKHGRKGFQDKKDWGLVFDVIDETVQKWDGYCGIAHNLYPTTSQKLIGNIQPFSYIVGHNGDQEIISVAHNGNLVCELSGSRPSDSDSWCFLESFGKTSPDRPLHVRIWQSVHRLSGAYSLVFLHQDMQGKNTLICTRDPHALRPLYIGRIRFKVRGKVKYGYVVASETRSFAQLGLKDHRPLKPGEIITINEDGVRSFRSKTKDWNGCARASCIFEAPYFIGANSEIETTGAPIEALIIREALGRKTAEEFRKKYPYITAEILNAIPDSSRSQGNGAAEILGISTKEFIFRNHGVGRTFIDEEKSIVLKISRKFSFSVQRIQKLKEIFLVDDSIVRGNTLKGIIEKIREINPKIKIHVIICYPPVISPCFLGIAMSTIKELAWYLYGQSVEGVRKAIKADTLYYISLKGFLEVIESMTGYTPDQWCTACITGKQPILIERPAYKREMEKFAALNISAASIT